MILLDKVVRTKGDSLEQPMDKATLTISLPQTMKDYIAVKAN